MTDRDIITPKAVAAAIAAMPIDHDTYTIPVAFQDSPTWGNGAIWGRPEPVVAGMLAAALPEVRMRLAELLEDELVCCDIYQRLEALASDVVAYRELKRSSDYHDICHFGAWAAAIVRGERI